MRIFASLVLIAYVVIIPVGICFLHAKRPNFFHKWKLALWVIGTAVFSWVFINAVIVIPYLLGLFCPRGPEAVFALFFGWSYLWFASLPVLVVYGSLKIIRRFISP